MTIKTPGVYIQEVSTFPPSVAAVETAIPAFIGYTALIPVRQNGTDRINEPIRIKSFLEFQQLFGGPFVPSSFMVTVHDSAVADAASVVSVTPRDTLGQARQFYLFDAVQLFYANGGGGCYIVSVGRYDEEIAYNTPLGGGVFKGLKVGLDAVQQVDEPTLLVFPDAVGLKTALGAPDLANFGNLQKDALAQCEKLQDRFALLDVMRGYLPLSALPVGEFRDGVGMQSLKYAAAYYPWLTGASPALPDLRNIAFQTDAAPPVAIGNGVLGALSATAAVNAIFTRYLDARAATDAVFDTLMTPPPNLIPGLTSANYNSLRSVYDARIADFQAATPATRALFGAVVDLLRGIALAFNRLDTAPLAPTSAVKLRITALKSDLSLVAAIVNLVSISKNANLIADVMPAGSPNDGSAYNALDNTVWIDLNPADGNPETTLGLPIDASIPTPGASIKAKGTAVFAHPLFRSTAEKLLGMLDEVFLLALAEEKKAAAGLFATHFFFRDVAQRLQAQLATMPPSGAVAGVYAAVDRARGVWKAPANVALLGIVGPVLQLTNADQDGLNIDAATGKSVNAIRTFTGKGTLVWGARTLAGNDNEWRYVSVRRFFNFVEESTKKATQPFVFEPNDANTWIKVQGMIENFLTIQWRLGALAGATPKDAFFVKVGLGQTMIPQDVLEGRMIVEIGMAAVRPAEFIILRFSHKMQES